MLATLVVVAFLLVAFLLVTPVDLDIRLERRPVFRYRLGVRWLYGLVAGELRPATERKERGTRKKERRKERRKPHHVAAMLRSKGFRRSATRLIRRLIRAMRIRDLALWMRAGLEDPASTGMLCGFLLPVVASFEALHPRVDVAPDFSQETLEFTFDGQVSLIPVELVWPIMAFSLSPSTWRGFMALRRGSAA